VVTVEKSPFLLGVAPCLWEAPETSAVLRARRRLGRAGVVGWPVAWIVLLGRLGSGAFVFHHPAERVFARRVLKKPGNAEGRPPLRVTALRLKRLAYWLYGP